MEIGHHIFKVRSRVRLKPDYILGHDPMYGQQIIVREELEQNYTYEVELVSNDKSDRVDFNNFNREIVWSVLHYRLFGEFSSTTSSMPEKIETPLTIIE